MTEGRSPSSTPAENAHHTSSRCNRLWKELDSLHTQSQSHHQKLSTVRSAKGRKACASIWQKWHLALQRLQCVPETQVVFVWQAAQRWAQRHSSFGTKQYLHRRLRSLPAGIVHISSGRGKSRCCRGEGCQYKGNQLLLLLAGHQLRGCRLGAKKLLLEAKLLLEVLLEAEGWQQGRCCCLGQLGEARQRR